MAIKNENNVKGGMKQIVSIFYYILALGTLANGYKISLVNDGPIVAGATINFTVSVFDEDALATGINLKYAWEDESIHHHTRLAENQNATDSWVITYNASVYPFGHYVVQVVIEKCVMWDAFCFEIGSARTEFEITETLNGALKLNQNNKTRSNDFVSNAETVIHEVDLKKSDLDYVKTAPTVLTYWFVDCTYYGITTDFKFAYNYTVADEIHFVEALVMADFTPIPPTTTVAPSTTTVKPNSTTVTPATTTIQPNSTTIKPITTSIPTTISPNVTTTSTSKSVARRSIDNSAKNNNVTSKISTLVDGKLVAYNGSFPFVCNGSQLTSSSMKTFGHFFKKIEVKAPLSNVNVNGNNWIQPGDLLSLKVSCTGSKNIDYCVNYLRGEYNVTGNETCGIYERLDTCSFRIKRYLWHPKTTILIIIKNEVSKIVTPVTVNIYKVNKQPQLSVIVVPVVFTLVAVVLIVFGVAYYIQNRSRFIIEVADFNFGQQYSDMEYKTFRERLRDSFAYAFSRGPNHGSSEVPVWPPGQKYGSMT
ncbi:uncharacterized protein [Leptinotarsa decemlineata]|uniref:uncharacterized protein n=1 Tax=Leptinotarsa decemlineata TaxID=7539 RepID=UPI003D309075